MSDSIEILQNYVYNVNDVIYRDGDMQGTITEVVDENGLYRVSWQQLPPRQPGAKPRRKAGRSQRYAARRVASIVSSDTMAAVDAAYGE